jgi:nucleoid-associated protein YgaU
MARETKVGLIVGLGVILFVSVFVSDYLSVPEAVEARTDVPSPNFVDQTTNQTELVLIREDETLPAAPNNVDPRDLAAVSLENIERHTAPPSVTIGPPPFREAPSLAGPIDDTTPPAIDLNAVATDRVPVGQVRIDDTQLAQHNQLGVGRVGPGNNPLAELAHVEIPEQQLINAQPVMVKHKVAAGETLTAIARKHYDGDGNMWRSIRDANPGKVGSNGEVVQGVVLTIPKRTSEAGDPTVQIVGGNGDGPERPRRQRVRMITVQEGDSLSELASEHLGSAGKWPQIMAVNSDVLEKPEQLRAGMKLRIPAEGVAQVIEEANNALVGSGEAQPERPEQPSNPNTYTVKEGDSLSSIAGTLLGNPNRYDDIYKANKDKLSSPDDIRVGMKLKLPNR